MDTLEVARRFEAKQLQLSEALAIETLRFREGAGATFGGPGGYSNRVCGFDLRAEDVAPAIAFFSERGEDTKLEVSSFASAPLLEALGEFRLRFFTHVLSMRAPAQAPVARLDGITIAQLDREDPQAVRAAALHNERCFAPPGTPIAEITIELTMRHLRMPTNETFVAHAADEIVGVGCSETSHGVTAIFGGATLPSFRNRGIQRALIATRLNRAATHKTELALLMTGPNTGSERNALAAGFTHAFARTYLLRPR
jgi:hypothetical protein